ncbi:hypothetical protein ACVWZA_002803 [Sphingomonas sp. UYAg733]
MEIQTELRRAAQAYGVWTPQLEAAWQKRTSSVQSGLQLASYGTPDGFAADGIASVTMHGPIRDAAVKYAPVEPKSGAGVAESRDLVRTQVQDLSVQPVGWPEPVNDQRVVGNSQSTDGQPNAAVPEFTVPANQTARRMDGTTPVGDYVRGKNVPVEENSAIRLSEVNAWLKAATVQNAANLAIEQAKPKRPLTAGPGIDTASSLTNSYDNARTGYELASLAESSRALVAANPDSPESDKNHLLEFANALELASTAMSDGRWIGANPISDFFSYNGIDYPDFALANQARLHNQSTQPSVSALTPEMIEEREKAALDRQILADRNDALPSAVERTYFTARAQGASLAELKQVIARGQFMDATLGVAGAVAGAGAARDGVSQARPPVSYGTAITKFDNRPSGLAEGSFLDLSRAANYQPGFYRAHPGAIRYGQHAASPNFSKDGTIRELIAELKNGKSPDLVGTPIRVIFLNGKAFTLDNRRLVAFKAAKLNNIPIQVMSPNDPTVLNLLKNKTRMDPIAGEGHVIAIVPKNGKSNQAEIRRALRERNLIKGQNK